jgi:hypothetical protein
VTTYNWNLLPLPVLLLQQVKCSEPAKAATAVSKVYQRLSLIRVEPHSGDDRVSMRRRKTFVELPPAFLDIALEDLGNRRALHQLMRRREAESSLNQQLGSLVGSIERSLR